MSDYFLTKMKILCFHPALAPYRVDFFNLLGEFSDLKMVFLQENLQTQRFDQKALLTKLKVPYEYLTMGIVLCGRCIRTGIFRLVRKESPDVVLAYEASPVTVELIILKKLGFINGQIWTSMDDSSDQVKSRKGLRRIIRDWVLRNVDKVIVPSQVAAETYYSLKINNSLLTENKYCVVPIIHDTATMRINADRIYAAGRDWRNTNCPKVWERIILFVGRLVEVKNLKWLIDRMCELPKTTGLVILGDGPLRMQLESQVKDLGLDERVLFVGRKEGDDVYSIMSVSDMLALASTSETFGAVVAEALLWGTPCIVSDNCGASTLIEDGKNGAVFTFNDAEGFKSAIERLPCRSNESLLECDLRRTVEMLVKG